MPGSTALHDVLAGLVASVDELIAGAGYKVFGRHELAVIPQTSTIASHLPRAVGVAFAIDCARKVPRVRCEWPGDAIAVASFGDASANHSTATGAINAASQAAYQGLPMPVLFVCEDNGIGISVPTPAGWIAAAYGDRPALRYQCRRRGHRRVLRRGHRGRGARPNPPRTGLPAPSGRAVQRAARGQRCGDQLSQPGRDRGRLRPRSAARHRPTGRAAGLLTPDAVLARYDATSDQVRALGEQVSRDRQLETVEDIIAPLAPRHPDRVEVAAAPRAGTSASPRSPESCRRTANR